MKFTTTLLLAAVIIPITACKKEKDEPAAPAPAAAQCGIPGARLQATFDGAAWCPNVSLFADLGAGVMTINGMTMMGSTLTLELDSLSPGTYEMKEFTNSILFTTTLAAAYRSTDEAPASLVITAHDTGAKRIQGSFSGQLYSDLSGASKPVTGSFDMTYLD
jgi:hypothetical protein